MGNRFRLIVNEVDVIQPEQALPKLPVARAVWLPKPSLKVAAAAWIYAGGAHHTGFSQALTMEHLRRLRRDRRHRTRLHRRRNTHRRASANSAMGRCRLLPLRTFCCPSGPIRAYCNDRKRRVSDFSIFRWRNPLTNLLVLRYAFPTQKQVIPGSLRKRFPRARGGTLYRSHRSIISPATRSNP